MEQVDAKRPVSIREMVQMSRSIDFARFHNTFEVPQLASTPEDQVTFHMLNAPCMITCHVRACMVASAPAPDALAAADLLLWCKRLA